MRPIRNCKRGVLNTGKSQCPLDLAHIIGAMVVEAGFEFPETPTASSLKEACHADRPNRIMPIVTFVEYAKEGGEASVSAVGYGGNQVTGISPRTDTFTLAQHDPALAASLSKAMNLPFEVFYFDENNVVYGRRVGDALRGFPITTLYPTVTPHPTSSNPATLTVSFAFKNSRDAIEDFDYVELDFNLEDNLVMLTEVELVSTGTNKYKIVEKVGGYNLTAQYGETIATEASSVFNGVSAATYDSAANELTVTLATGATAPTLKSPSALYTAGIYGISA